VDQPRDAPAQLVGIVEPGEKIVAGQLVPPAEVARDGVQRAPG
jgi:hypothetical protein